MNSKISDIVKILLLSTAISAVIKYAAPSLAIAATATHAMIAILLPSVVMAIALGWRARSAER